MNSDSESYRFSPSMIIMAEPSSWILIFTTPAPQKYNIDNSISENYFTKMNLLVQGNLIKIK